MRKYFECESCECMYLTGPEAWHWQDELFCFTCYHEKYPCPPWCPEWED